MTEPPDVSLGELQQKVLDFARDRDWLRFHNPRHVAEAILVEAGELLECFLWRSDEDCVVDRLDQARRGAVEAELADVLIYALNLANALEVDAAQVILTKLRSNADKYPATET